ncbi:ferritin-like domain-containing protein [Streptantibioticus parmotrematis]|uniref:ferritin-like domain-containing protein n=1 Tax=Streptantibioticus parmotrematis TaxID=2873249 RepID=UPI0033D8B798
MSDTDEARTAVSLGAAGTSPAAGARARLIDHLCEAAELEHSLCLQYLYAAFSLKTRADEGGVDEVQVERVREWKGQLLLLSREEMLHLGLVLNLLAAVGGAPYLQRPSFPQPERYYPIGVVSALEPFGAKAIERFLRYEMPTALLGEVTPGHVGADGERMTVGMLYERVREAVTTIDEKELFIGSEYRQIDTAAVIDPEGVFEDAVATGYGVEPFPVTDRASALRAIDLIIEQGEGAEADSPQSHYGRLLRVRAEFEAETRAAADAGTVFEPARPTLSNPVLRGPVDGDGAVVITEPLTRAVAEVFNDGYALMVLMLLRFYGRTDDTPTQMRMLQEVVFFPLMTMFVRPLGEVLTELPAISGQDAATATAGAPFEFGRGLQLIPERAVAYQVFAERLAGLASAAARLTDRCDQADAVSPALRKRVAFIAENVGLVARRFADRLNEGADRADA